MSAALSGFRVVVDESVLRRFLRLRRLTLGLTAADIAAPSSSLARLELELASQDVSWNRSVIETDLFLNGQSKILISSHNLQKPL